MTARGRGISLIFTGDNDLQGGGSDLQGRSKPWPGSEGVGCNTPPHLNRNHVCDYNMNAKSRVLHNGWDVSYTPVHVQYM